MALVCFSAVPNIWYGQDDFTRIGLLIPDSQASFAFGKELESTYLSNNPDESNGIIGVLKFQKLHSY